MSALDPAEWPLIVKLVAGWGPLAAGWLWAEVRRAREASAHHATRDAHEKTLERMNKEFATAIKSQADEYALQLTQRDSVKHQQVTMLTERFVTLIDRQHASTTRLLEKAKDRKDST